MADSERNVFILGVTGGIACGKSEVGRILDLLGISVCDSDFVAHELMKKGAPVFLQVVEYFGPKILAGDGEISRPILGKIIFENPEQRDVLNRLVHPAVRDVLKQWMAEKRKAEKNGAVLIPLLFESGMQDLQFDAVWCVSSREPEIFQRLKMRGLGREEAENRVHSQMPLPEKEKRADYVVPNLGTLGELEMVVQQAVHAMVER